MCTSVTQNTHLLSVSKAKIVIPRVLALKIRRLRDLAMPIGEEPSARGIARVVLKFLSERIRGNTRSLPCRTGR